MTRRNFVVTSLSGVPALAQLQSTATRDERNIKYGSQIPREGYSDQPYVVVTNDGNWLCTLTTGKGVEGEPGQHIVSTISRDQGRTWSKPVDIEPGDGPEASWVMPLKTPSGRVYVFYTYNRDNLRLVAGSNSPSQSKRVDTLGSYMFKYSDDNGLTWSKERYEIPMRQMRIDRENLYGGKVLFFWGVGKPIIHDGKVWFGFAKVGKWGDPGSMVESQGCFMRSDNLLSERDPERIRWQLLPDGDEGLRAPKGPVSDEANPVALSDGSLYCTYRTIDGYNCHAYSRDGGHTWTPPAYATYANGRPIKHPRAANFVRKFSNGKFLLWYHNHGGEPVHAAKWSYYMNRNPGWVCGGVEKNGKILWSEPEILLYDEDAQNIRISYPDFIEQDGRYFITETQKTAARVHEIDTTLLEGLWGQHENRSVTRKGLLKEVSSGNSLEMPALPSLGEGSGFAIDFWVRFRELTPGQVILDSRDASGKGLVIEVSDRFTLRLQMNDGKTKAEWDSDPGTHPGTLRIGSWQHVAVVVDGGPRIISWLVDGIFNDGGAVRQFGFGRFPAALGDVNGAASARLASNLFGQLGTLRVYGRYLRTSEAVGNFRAGRGA